MGRQLENSEALKRNSGRLLFVLHVLVRWVLIVLFRIKEIILIVCDGGRFNDLPVSVNYYPRGLGIEVANLCNANCVFCSYQYRQRPLQFMSQENFEKIILDYVRIGGGKGGIGLTPVVGDPLLDRDLVRKISFARAFSQMHDIHLTTNAIMLTKELFEKLVDAGLTMMTISMSGFDPVEYKRIYRTPAYDKVLANLRAIASSERFKKCQVEIGLRTDSLFHWFKKEYWELRSYGFKISRNWFFDDWSGRIRQEDLSHFMFLRPERQSKRVPCWILYQSPQVLADGEVTACGCRDLEGTSELRLGNIHERSLAEILDEKKLEILRNRFLEGNPPDVCRDCKFYTPMTRARHRQGLIEQNTGKNITRERIGNDSTPVDHVFKYLKG
ncbi:MAG: radical SAM protein [Candidatus Omnitrophica bacterium]|nr:radical SAM protein [Candidatus Omnitrophota bacterium]